MRRVRRVCLYFGSFNPLHRGHTALAAYALEQLEFDRVWLVLSPLNPLKEARDQLPWSTRRALLLEAISGYRGLELCPIEVDLPEPHYTVRTIRALELLHPQLEFALLIGADNLLILPRWYAYERLLSTIPLYVYPRPDYPLGELPEWTNLGRVTYCADAPQCTISSTEIRLAIRSGLDVRHLLACPSSWERLVEALGKVEGRVPSTS